MQTPNTEFVRHTCNPAKPGMPLPFGRKAPAGDCRRCDQLRGGAAPRQAPAALRAGLAKQAREDQRAREIRAHFAPDSPHARGECGPVCTAFDW